MLKKLQTEHLQTDLSHDSGFATEKSPLIDSLGAYFLPSFIPGRRISDSALGVGLLLGAQRGVERASPASRELPPHRAGG